MTTFRDGEPWRDVHARLIPGHQVASGRNGNPRFPGGTLRMQFPHFKSRGLDLECFHLGTLNVSIAPRKFQAVAPKLTFRDVKWHPTAPAEDFSFFDVRLVQRDKVPVAGLIYFPHPETKPEHFQHSDTLELLMPFIEGLMYGSEVHLQIPGSQLAFD